jgi:uncharacterized membrane protein YkgB
MGETQPAPGQAQGAPRLSRRLDARLTTWMARRGPLALRWALGAVFVWFGALKVAGLSPVGDLVARTVDWADPSWFVPLLGAWEVAVGLGLLLAVGLRLVLALFWLQLAGTFLVLVLRPDLAFQGGNPLLLTVEGEFVVKNLVLIAGGIVVGGTLAPRRRSAPSRQAGPAGRAS